MLNKPVIDSGRNMSNRFTLLLLSSTLFIQACSLAPFSPTTSGKSLGKGNLQTDVGQANDNFFIRLGVGLGEDFDAGFVTEFGALATSAIFFKYSIINQPIGPSWNLEGGYGTSGSTTYYYMGSTGSIAFSETIELFLGGKLINVATDEADIELGDYYGNLQVNEYDLFYAQISYGMNLWLSNNIGLSLYNIHFKGDDIETKQDATFGAAFLYKL